jgi:hypothetical protein
MRSEQKKANMSQYFMSFLGYYLYFSTIRPKLYPMKVVNEAGIVDMIPSGSVNSII